MPLALCSVARRGAGGGGSVSHGDSRFRCRKGGSAGWGCGEEARLFTRLKRARGCVPRLPTTCLSLPLQNLFTKGGDTQSGGRVARVSDTWCSGSARNQKNTPQKKSKAAPGRQYTHTNAHRLP